MTSVLTKEEALKRFTETFSPQELSTRKDRQRRVEILMRFIIAIDMAARAEDGKGLTFSGQRPNDYDALGTYLVNGGRLFFDMSQLPPQDKKIFDEFLFPKSNDNIFYQRIAGTHKISTKIINNQKYVYEKKLSPFQSLLNVIKQIVRHIKPAHFGMDIGIGGAGNNIVTHTGESAIVRNNGEFGHLYVNKHSKLDAIQMGFEEAAPGKKFVPGGGWHGPDGKGSQQSACMTEKLENQQFGKDGKDRIIPTNDPNSKYAWNRIVITPDIVKNLAEIDPTLLNATEPKAIDNVKKILNTAPANCEKINNYEERNEKIILYRKEHGLIQNNVLSNEKFSDMQGIFANKKLPKLMYYKTLLARANTGFEQHLILYAIFSTNETKSLANFLGRSLGISPDKIRNDSASWLMKDLKISFPDTNERRNVTSALLHKIEEVRHGLKAEDITLDLTFAKPASPSPLQVKT